MKPGVAARRRAAEILDRVVNGGAHSNVLLDQPSDLSPVQRATTHRLVLDALRWLPRLDVAIAARSSRPLGDVDPEVLSVLRIATVELMTGGDAHGVVDSAVESIRTGDQAKASGFVNAVLRRLSADGLPRLGDGDDDRAYATGTPPWLRKRLVEELGEPSADAFLRATLDPAPIGVRLRPGAESEGLLPVPGIVDARWAPGRESVTDAMVVMDPASTAVIQALDVHPGHTVLDMAMAPGNKTLGIVDALGGSGMVVAADQHPRRTRSTAKRFARLGAGVTSVVADGRRPPFRHGSFDRILLDAPCTGLGTVRRRPEIKLHLDPDSPDRMAVVQRALLEAALPLLRPGGRLVYSVCTVFAAETAAIVAGAGARPPDDLPGSRHGDGLLLGPHLSDTDGMFIAVIDR